MMQGDQPVVDKPVRTLTTEEANAIQWRELDVEALAPRVEAVWQTIEKLQDAQTVSKETLAREISV